MVKKNRKWKARAEIDISHTKTEGEVKREYEWGGGCSVGGERQKIV